MQILYPELKPYQRHQLKVSDQHELYVDEAGNVDGIPVLFVHGARAVPAMQVPAASMTQLSIALSPSISAAVAAPRPMANSAITQLKI